MRLLGLVLLLLLASSASAQGIWRDYPFTLTTAIARLPDASPFETDDWLIEVGEYDLSAGIFESRLPLWGPNAIAYPQTAGAVSWSPGGDWLALTSQERQKASGIWIYHLGQQSRQEVLPPEYAELSPLSWARDTSFAVFSADGLIYRVLFPDMSLEVLTEGQFPVLTDGDQTLFFLNPDQQISFWDLPSGEVQSWQGQYLEVSSLALSPDGKWLALTQGPYLTLLERGRPLPYRLFDALDGRLDSVAWSPNSQQIAFVLRGAAFSQVWELQRVHGESRLIWETPLADEARIVIGVAYQQRGAFIPPRENADDI